MNTLDKSNWAGSPEQTPAPSITKTFWRVEGSLLNLSAVRPVAYFTWNAQSFSERWQRRGGLALLAIIRPLLVAIDRIFATRVLHTLLRGISQDRLDLLGEEYFNYNLKPQLKQLGIAKLKEAQARGEEIVLVSQGLDHVMRPLAQHLGVDWLITNRLDFRDGMATGRLLSPVIRPRQVLARIIGGNPDGRIDPGKLARKLGFGADLETLNKAIISSKRAPQTINLPTVIFDTDRHPPSLSVHNSLAARNILLIGFTGFIGKVWLEKVLEDVPDVGKVYLLVRRQRSTTGRQRVEKIIDQSPAFEPLRIREGKLLREFVNERIEVIEGDVTLPGLGIDTDVRLRLQSNLDLIINSSGLTDFNPDLRQALAVNVDGTVNLLEYLRQCDHAALLHLSTSYVVGYRDGRIDEKLQPDYTPNCTAGFDAEKEYRSLLELAKEIESRGEGDEVGKELRAQIIDKHDRQATRQSGRQIRRQTESEIEAQLRKQRQRWIRNELTEAGMKRAREFGWPNTYTFTKSLAESLIVKMGRGLPIAIVRPSIVETSTHDPFEGWNEGVNTSAPLSYLLGTFFRQLPSNGKKCLDIIPVDLVVRGMILIAAALIERRHESIYQLATSAVNPCDMRRSIELTGLAHRKHYRAQDDFNFRLLSLFDSIPVSKERYQKLSAPRQKQVIQALMRIMAPLPMMRSPLIRRARDLDKVEKLIELYEPFILHNEYIFEAKNVEMLSKSLPPEEREDFGYDASYIDWWDYWINVHIPALRKWSYPIIEGRPLEQVAVSNQQPAVS